MRDIDIRAELKSTFLSKYYADPKSKVVNELSVSYGDAIIDIAVINGALHGYEIKSEFDTLTRLPSQLSSYSKTFDYLTVISAQRHLNSLLSLLPQWCGIIIVEKYKGGERLRQYRKPKKNYEVNNYSVAQLLWKEEILEVLNDLGIGKGKQNKSKPILWALMANTIKKKELSNIVREKLKIRANWKSVSPLSENDGYSQLSAKFPDCLCQQLHSHNH